MRIIAKIIISYLAHNRKLAYNMRIIRDLVKLKNAYNRMGG